MEKRHKPLQDKNRKFLEKNMALTAVNRNLEEKIQRLTDEAGKLKCQVDRNKKENQKLSDQLTFEKLERSSFEKMLQELMELRRLSSEQEKSINALKLSCTEKDRKIEQISTRRRKERYSKALQKVAGIKETYYGYDEEDCHSVNSEISSSSRLSSSFDMPMDDDDDDVFEEFTREEYARNYQRLAQEHLELEKSFALLQSQVSTPRLDPQRAEKMRAKLAMDLSNAQSRIADMELMIKETGHDTDWLEEKNALNMRVGSLNTKLSESEQTIRSLQAQLADAAEENEVLEFQILELQEANQQLSEEVGRAASLSSSNSAENVDHGTDEKRTDGNVDNEAESSFNLLNLQVRSESGDTLVLQEAVSMLDVADKKIKELLNTQKSLEEQLNTVQEEKAQLAVTSSKVSNDNLQQVEVINEQLKQAQLQIGHLEKELGSSRQAEAVFRYEKDFYEKTENRYKGEIDGLKRQLSSSHEGRDFESELLVQKLDQLNAAEQNIASLEATKRDLEERVALVVQENEELRHQLDTAQETASLTESDAERPVLISKLQAEVSLHEKAESEANEKNRQLTEQLVESEQASAILKTQLVESTQRGEYLETTLQSMRDRCIAMATDLTVWKKRAAELTAKLEQASAECQQMAALQRSIDILKADNEKLQSDLEAESKEYNEKISHLQEELSSMHAPATRAEKLERRVAEMEASEAQLCDTIADLERLQQMTSAAETESQRARIAELLETCESQNAELGELRDSADAFGEQIRDLEANETRLKEREAEMLRELELVREAGARLVDKVDMLEESEARLQEQLQGGESPDDRLKTRIWQLEAVIERLQNAGSDDEVTQLREKLDRLLDSEEVILEQLQSCEAQLEQRDSQLRQYKTEFDKRDSQLQLCESELDKCNSQLQEYESELSRRDSDIDEIAQKLQESQENLAKTNAELNRLRCENDNLTQTDKTEELRGRITELEQSERALKTTITELQERVITAELSRQTAAQEVSIMTEQLGALQNKMATLETSESAAGKRAEELTSQNSELLSAVKTLQHKVATLPLLGMPQPIKGRLSPSRIETLSKDEMAAEICELVRADSLHRNEISELSTHLDVFRDAVQVAALSIDLDIGSVPVSKMGPKFMDGRLERQIEELVVSEGELRKRLVMQEEKCNSLRRDLEAAEKSLLEQEEEYRDALEVKDKELDVVHKREARLKNEMRYSGGENETEALAKLQHLEELVFDLEASERQLKAELRSTEARVKLQSRRGVSNDKAQTSLSDSEKALLLDRISRLQASEKQLIHMIEKQQADFNASGKSKVVLDLSDSLLRHRIAEHESTEMQFRQRIVELEKDREDMHNQLHSKDSKLCLLQAELADLQVVQGRVEVATSQSHAQLTARLRAAESASERRSHELDTLRREFEDKEIEMKEQLRIVEGRLDVSLSVSEQRRMSEESAMVRVAELESAAEVRTTELKHIQQERDRLNIQLSETERSLRQADDTSTRLENDIRQLQRSLAEQGRGHGATAEREQQLRAELVDLTAGKASLERLLHESQNAETRSKLKMAELMEELERIQGQTTIEDVAVRSKDTQVQFADNFCLRQMSSNDILYAMKNSKEFLTSLDQLGAQHPQAYDDFMRLLQPSFVNVSCVRVRPDDPRENVQVTPRVCLQRNESEEQLSANDAKDDMTMSMNFDDEFEDSQSDVSVEHPPPLPQSLPPVSSCQNRYNSVSPQPNCFPSDSDGGATKLTNGELPELGTLRDKITKLEQEIQSRDRELAIARRQRGGSSGSKPSSRVTNEFSNDNGDLSDLELTNDTNLNDAENITNHRNGTEFNKHADKDEQNVIEHYKTKIGELEKVIEKLNSQLNDYERIDLERQSLEKKVKAIEEELKQKCDSERLLSKNNASLKHQLEAAKEKFAEAEKERKDFSELQMKYETLEKMQSASQLMLTPLRARVIRLARKCKAKDGLIGQLSCELRQYGSTSNAVESAELDKMDAGSEDYTRPISPQTTEADLRHVDSSSLSPRSDGSTEDNEISTLLSKLSGSLVDAQKCDGVPRAIRRGVVYRAIANFDSPKCAAGDGFCLREGDMVTLLGAVDADGYVQVSLREQVGWVPLSHLQASPAVNTRRHRKQSLPNHNGVGHRNLNGAQPMDYMLAQSVPVTPTHDLSPAGSRSTSPSPSVWSQRRLSTTIRHPAFGQMAARSPLSRRGSHTEKHRTPPSRGSSPYTSGSSTLPRAHKSPSVEIKSST